MKMYELLFSLKSDQYIMFKTDHERDAKCGKRHGPMKAGNVTVDTIGAKQNLWKRDVYNICTFQRDGKDILYFNIGETERTKNRLDMWDIGCELIEQESK